MAVGSVMVTVSVSSQPLASVTVTVYVPAARLDAVAPVALFDHAYEYGAVPPEPLAVADPSLDPLQLALVGVPVLATTAVGSVIVTLAVAVHPLSSVAVTVYVPADRLDAEAELPAPPLQL